MGIGLGVVLLVIGLILVLNVVQFDLGFIDESGLGWILLIAGIIAIVLSLVINRQRTQRTTSEPPRTDPPRTDPPRNTY